jgi:type II secretory pathway pseudopilin PulG
MVLLEVLLALTILGMVGAALTALALESGRSVARTAETERELRRASGFLEAVALWPRDDLDRRLGTRRQGAWLLTIDRRSTALYAIRLRDSTGSNELLHTVLYRPGPADSADAR